MMMKVIISQSVNPLGDWYDYFWPISDWIIFVIITFVEGFVFFKLRFRLDISGLLTLILHYVVTILRLINHYQPFNSGF
jgi:hypothetical protein